MEGSHLKLVGMSSPSFPPKPFHVEGRYNPLLLNTFPGTTEHLLFATDGLIFPFSLTLPSVARVRYIYHLSACCVLFQSEPRKDHPVEAMMRAQLRLGVQGGLVSAPHCCGSEM